MLATAIPARCAASRSIVFTPTPIFWISLSFGAFAIMAGVTGFSTCNRTSESTISRGEGLVVGLRHDDDARLGDL